MPQHYPYPAYGYPAYQPPQLGQPPPQVVFGAPFPIYYPPPPQYGYKNKKARDKRAKRTQNKEPKVHYSQPQGGRNSKYPKSPRVHHSLPVYNDYTQENHTHRRRVEIFDPDRNDVLKRYKVFIGYINYYLLFNLLILLTLSPYIFIMRKNIFLKLNSFIIAVSIVIKLNLSFICNYYQVQYTCCIKIAHVIFC